jgi:hypothetical protein
MKEIQMLTIFALPKPFKGHFGIIQRNAISQWARLRPRPEILLFGDEEGTPAIAQEFGLRHIPEVKRNQYGTPLLSDLFEKAHVLASNNILCYVNADIMLLSGFVEAVQRVASGCDRYLMVGRRTNVDLDEPVIYESAHLEPRLLELVSREGELAGPAWIDYFVFPRGPFSTIPAFAIGRPRWDNWMLWKTRKLSAALVDATEVVLAVHQNHDYSHHPQGLMGVLEGEEGHQNRRLAGHGYCTIEDATHKLTAEGIKSYRRPFLSSVKQDARTWWWELLRVTVPIRKPLGLRRQNIARVLDRIRLLSN